MGAFARQDDGQALAVVTIGAFVLAVALAVTIDFGYSLMQRRIVQNQADNIGLGVGRLLATSVVDTTSSDAVFGATVKDACDTAVAIRARDHVARPDTAGATPALVLTFEKYPQNSTSPFRSLPNVLGGADCLSGSAALLSTVPTGTNAVHVRVTLRYQPLVGSLLRTAPISVEASARVALAGAPYDVNTQISANSPAERARSATAIVRTWPMALRYNGPGDISGSTCGPLCDPGTATPLRFADGTGPTNDAVLLDLSRESSYRPTGRSGVVGQLITHWDEPVEARRVTRAARLATWFNEPFENKVPYQTDPLRGVLGLDTQWADMADSVNNDPPAQLPTNSTRSWCSSSNTWLATPSCGSASNRTKGDWIETAVDRPGWSVLVSNMGSFIAREGTTTPFSSKTAPMTGLPYGKAVVVWIYLWDCGQQFQDGDWPRDRSGSCVRSTSQVNRVHMFSVIPVTFYEGLVTADAGIWGYWGGGFVDPGRCETMPNSCRVLNPLANTAFFVRDDSPLVGSSGGGTTGGGTTGGGTTGGGGGNSGGDNGGDWDDWWIQWNGNGNNGGNGDNGGG